ncbi:MAG: ATP synthase F1 subunit delta [Patescibacteria group bacterium]|jgi:F-type H+-transporting ATPase subunit delta
MRKLKPKQYAAALYQAIKDQPIEKCGPIFHDFLAVVWRNKDWKNLSKITGSFLKYYLEQENVLEATAVFASQPANALAKNLQVWLAEFTKKNVNLKTEVDPALLGGLVIKYDDLIFDGSLNTQLSILQKQLINNNL